MGIATYAVLARETYNLMEDTSMLNLPLDWSIKKIDVVRDHHGNCFGMFVNKKLKEIVLSVRGTSNIKNLDTDFKLAVARVKENKFLPSGQAELEELAERILLSNAVSKEGYNLKIIGYSLGAVMAELCAVKYGLDSITFESPGSLHLMQQHQELYPAKNYRLITSYLSAPNCINSLDSHPGNIFRMYLPQSRSLNCRHIMECMLSSMFLLPAYNMVVDGIAMATKGSQRDPLSSIGVETGVSPLIYTQDILWLMEQHSIENIAKFLLTFGKVVQMDSWPTTPLINISEQVQQHTFVGNMLFFSKIFLPFQKDQLGIRNIFDEEGMKIAQNRNILGYKEHQEESIVLMSKYKLQ